MKLGITMGHLNDKGTLINIVDDDMNSLEIYKSYKMVDDIKAIHKAKNELEKLIKKLDKLALYDNPKMISVHTEVNGFED